MQKKKLSLWEMISYGGGDIANCITFCATSSYLSYYYTDVVGVSLAAVGVILGTARVLEAIANLCTGIAIDQTNSKMGRTKPYLYATTIPLMLLFFLLFTVPDTSKQGKTIFAFVTYLVFCLLYAVNNTAYGTLLSAMTGDAKERKRLNNYKMLGCGIGNMIASMCTLPLVALIGNEGHFGFVTTALLYAIVSLLLLGNCAVVCKERVGIHQEKMPFIKSLRYASKSSSWVVLCVISCLGFMQFSIRNQSWIYYAKYCLGKESWATILLTVSTISMIVTSPFMARILTRLGNKKCMFLGFSMCIVFSLGVFVAKDNFVFLLMCSFLNGMGNNLATGPAYTICSDTIDEVEKLTGKRPQGTMTAVMMCAMKLGVAGAGIVFSVILNAGGYVADGIQGASAVNAIHWNMFWLPMILSVMCLGLTCFFRLENK